MGDGVQHVGMQALSLPRHFTDCDLSEWLDRFETCAAANHWDDAEQLMCLPTFLDGRAYNRYRWLQAGERDDMVNHRTNLINLVQPPEARETRRLELSNFKYFPDEKIDQFVYRLERKFTQAHPNMEADALANQRGEMLKISFIAGLTYWYQNKLREIPGLSYAQAQLYARQYKAADQYNESRNVDTANNSGAVTPALNSVNDKVSALESSLAALSLGTTIHYTGCEATIKQEPEWRTNASRPYFQSDRNDGNRTRNSTQLTCYTCGGIGYVQCVCPSNLRASERDRYRDISDSRDRYRSHRNYDDDRRRDYHDDDDLRNRDRNRNRNEHRDYDNYRHERSDSKDRGCSRYDRSDSKERTRNNRQYDRSDSCDRQRHSYRSGSPYPDTRNNHKFNSSHTATEFLEY